jgi:hypothetical protein
MYLLETIFELLSLLTIFHIGFVILHAKLELNLFAPKSEGARKHGYSATQFKKLIEHKEVNLKSEKNRLCLQRWPQDML